jgi:hypothetical protein
LSSKIPENDRRFCPGMILFHPAFSSHKNHGNK